MPDRHLPVRPNLDQLKHQAKDLLRAFRRGDPDAIAEFHEHLPKGIEPGVAKLADAQHVLALSYGAPNWPRLVQSCKLIDAIWRDDVEAVRKLVVQNPKLLHENAGIRSRNWGPPLSYAANLGRDEIIKLLHKFGAMDLEYAMGRAMLQSKIKTATMLYKLLGSPAPPKDALGGPAYTLSVSGTAFALEIGTPVCDADGKRLAPVDVVLESDSRNPSAKHEILELYVQHGLELPDTPTMALHRGRIDLLEEHLRRDLGLLRRTFTHEEIYPPELGCHDEIQATQGTPLKGTTLLHLCVDYDELEIAKWLLAHGMNVDAKAAVNADGFGGYTALFATVVSQPNFWMNHGGRPQIAPFAQLLLDHGANPNARGSLRKKLHSGYAPKYDVDTTYEYRNVTPLGWGKQFHAKVFVSEPAMRLIAERGGQE
ncbi:MAG: ankyrin repeat domain-containing protein [Acidobacteria bacterium]|nr:ankyrin repeat domain-containing protein [Acidobacteriota bacterium]